MPTAAIYDCEGALPTEEERAFFRDTQPLGFILFADHCESPDQVRRHTDMLREAVGREDVLFLIDQEGGRVARMKPPVFPKHPAPAVFGELWKLNPAKAREAARLNARLIAEMCSSLGVNVVCAPMLDVPQIDSDKVVIGDRALAAHPDIVAALGREVMEGTVEGGALPVIKHLPGHGRSLVDSHHDLPKISASKRDLQSTDFPPFKALNNCLMGMTGHLVIEAYDDALCATMSPIVVNDVIRCEIGFDGLLFSDDLKMHALGGDIGARARDSLASGCDVALCCNFDMSEKKSAAKHIRELKGEALRRVQGVLNAMPPPASDRDRAADYERLTNLLKPVAIA